MKNTSSGKLLLCLSSLFGGMVFYAPIATYYREARGIDILQISLIESISLGVGLLLEVPWGYVADRIGYKKTLCISSGVLFASKIVFWKAHSFPVFLLERLLLAVSNSAQSGVDIAYLSRIDGRQKWYGIYQASGMAGLMVVSLLFPFLKNPVDESGALTVLSCFVSLLCILLLPEAEGEKKKGGRMIHIPSVRKSELLFLTSIALFSTVNQVVTVFLIQMRYEASGLSVSLFSWPYLALSAVSVTGGWLSPFLYAKRHATLWCFAIALFGSLLLVRGTGVASALCGVMCLRLGFTLFQPYASKMQVSFSLGFDQATTLSFQQIWFGIVEMALSPLFGALAKHSLATAFLLGAGLLAVASLCMRLGTTRG
ncbi:MAG: MFS transporter [Sphaerochaetaceae bacterium]